MGSDPAGHLAQVASGVRRLDRSGFFAARQFDGRDAAERGNAKESLLRTPVDVALRTVRGEYESELHHLCHRLRVGPAASRRLESH